MKVFISHASANKDVVMKFADLLREVSGNEIQVFCSSEAGTIRVGKDFVDVILTELRQSDLFIPIISKEYYESRFCVAELGIACAYYYDEARNQEHDYIYPFTIFPIRRAYALSGTPISNLQADELNNPQSLVNFFTSLKKEYGIKQIPEEEKLKRRLKDFSFNVDQLLLKGDHLLELSLPGAFFDNSIFYQDEKDVARWSFTEDGAQAEKESKKRTITLNFNMDPYERAKKEQWADVKQGWPHFVSLALRYVDPLDLGRYLDFNINSTLDFTLNSFTNSLSKITVEFKYSDQNKILRAFEMDVSYKNNALSIPLASMQSSALSRVTEICFVIHPGDVNEPEGMFEIGNLHVNFDD